MAGSVGSEEGDIGFQIAPMVDVVFVLMLFFMASAGMQVAERELAVNLPAGSAPGSAPAVTPIIIEIGPEGTVSMNNLVYGQPGDKELKPLEDKLKELLAFGENDPVIIRPNVETRHDRIIDVLNCATRAAVKNLTFS